jgi:DDE superfamily endonuclease
MRKIKELLHREVAGMRCHKVEKPRFGAVAFKPFGCGSEAATNRRLLANSEWSVKRWAAGCSSIVPRASRRLRLPLLVVWDRLPAHRSRLVQDYLASLQGWVSTAYLPPYAPELNPVECIWAYWKQHELPNVCPQDYWQLTETAR